MSWGQSYRAIIQVVEMNFVWSMSLLHSLSTVNTSTFRRMSVQVPIVCLMEWNLSALVSLRVASWLSYCCRLSSLLHSFLM